jgi:hypothetical protein
VVIIEDTNAEEEFLTQTTILSDFKYNIPTMINNTASSTVEPISFNSTIQTKIEKVNYQDHQDSQPSLSVMINNALLGKMEPISFNSTALDNVKEQFITIKQDEYNKNMIFEETDKKEVLTTKVPFILPVPFP